MFAWHTISPWTKELDVTSKDVRVTCTEVLLRYLASVQNFARKYGFADIYVSNQD